MTFIIDQGGLVLQKDLAADTANIAKAIDAFDPDDTWQAPGRVTLVTSYCV